MNTEDVLDYVEGLSDTQLSIFAAAVGDIQRDRRNKRARRIAATLEVGTRVQISNNIKPKYLQGQYGEVIDIKERRALVRLDRGPQGKFRTGNVLCPFAVLTVVDR